MMQKTLLAKFIDNLTLFLSLFLLSVLLFSSILHSLTALLLTALVTTLIVYYFLNLVIQRFSSISALKKEEAKHLKDVLETFKFYQPSKLYTFWENALKSKFSIINKLKNGFIITTNTSKIYFTYNFYTQETSLEEIFSALEVANNYNATLYFLSPNFSIDALNLQSKFTDIRLFDAQNIYKILKLLNSFPEIPKTIKEKRSFSKVFSLITAKPLAKNYFKLALILFVLALFVPFKNYYSFFASLALLFTIICLTKKSPKTIPLGPIFE